MILEHLDGISASERKLGLSAAAIECLCFVAMLSTGLFDPFHPTLSPTMQRVGQIALAGLCVAFLLALSGLLFDRKKLASGLALLLPPSFLILLSFGY